MEMRKKLLGLLVALLLSLSTNVNAVIIGDADANTGNCFPFGCIRDWQPTYQQIWDSSAFSSSITISSLTFYNTVLDSGDYTSNSGNYTIELSTTSAAVDGLSTTASDNVGADNMTVFVGSIFTDMGAFGGSFDILFDSAFNYDPTMGNLLMQVSATGLSITGETFFDQDGDFGDTQSRYYSTSSFVDTLALVTGFNEAKDVQQVPEPGMLLLISTALAGLGFTRRRMKT